MKRVIVAGSRTFNDYDMVRSILDIKKDREGEDIIIVSGGARGADRLGELYAQDNNLECHLYEANWSKYGKAAGPLRNEEMADNADMLLAFWDGRSPGTSHMIKTARKKGLHVELFINDTSK